MWLVTDAMVGRLTGAEDDGVEDEIQTMKTGKFLKMTTWSDGTESDVKMGDKRERFGQ
jgi:hypothetical protein